MSQFDVIAASARLGDAIRHRRREYGLTQAQLALLAGVGTRSVHAIENGKPTARLDSVLPVLNALGMLSAITGPVAS